LQTFVKSKEELTKAVKTRLHFENGGCYRPEELSYLSERYQGVKEILNLFLVRMERPDESFARDFEEIYAPVKTAIDSADSEIRANLASRARILFPNDNKKKTQTWAKKALSEKLLDLSDDKLKEFVPESLPGISANPIPIEGDNPTIKNQAIQRRYSTLSSEGAREVVTSWYASFDPAFREDEE